jgi:hypothetical protein
MTELLKIPLERMRYGVCEPVAHAIDSDIRRAPILRAWAA